MKLPTLRVVFVLALLACVGCGGGGGSAPPSLQPAPRASQAGLVTPSFALRIPLASTSSTTRHAAYLSPSTLSVKITLNSVNGSAPPQNLTLTLITNIPAGSCTKGCTVFGPPSPAGNDNFTIVTYDAANGGGNALSQQTQTFTIVAGNSNSNAITLLGIPASIALSGLPSLIVGTPLAPTALSVTVYDADGNPITGVYAVVITLVDNDPANPAAGTELSLNGGAPSRTVQITSSSDVVTLSYGGAGVVAFTLTASANGATTGSTTVTPVVPAPPPPPAPTLTGISAATGVAGGMASETLTGTNFSAGATVNVSGTLVTVSHVVVVNATTITAQFFVDPSAAQTARNATVTTTGGTTGAQTFTITAPAANATVTLATDANAGAPAGTGTGNAGDLRYAMLNTAAGNTIVFNTQAMCGAATCTITLNGPLPPIVQNQTIDGGAFGRVIIDGNALYRAFFVDSGTVVLQNLQIQNAKAQGGNGGGASAIPGGGGGAGLGAGVFVNQAGASVSVTNVYFLNCTVQGGAGGGFNAPAGGGGGGGLSGNGGNGPSNGGNGGGGVLASGANAVSSNGSSGGTGGGGGGGGDSSPGTGGAGAPAYAGDTVGSNGVAGSGGNGGAAGAGGFGGGGGGGGNGAPRTGGNGGSGGFGGGGGGGGGGTLGGLGGNGGAGGGGGGGANGSASGIGGTLATVSGGNGDTSAHSGGGAAAGPAIFVNLGTVTTTNSGASGSSATSGAAGGGTATAGTADATPVFNFGGMVDGSATTGPVAGALSGSMPMSVRRRVP